MRSRLRARLQRRLQMIALALDREQDLLVDAALEEQRRRNRHTSRSRADRRHRQDQMSESSMRSI